MLRRDVDGVERDATDLDPRPFDDAVRGQQQKDWLVASVQVRGAVQVRRRPAAHHRTGWHHGGSVEDALPDRIVQYGVAVVPVMR